MLMKYVSNHQKGKKYENIIKILNEKTKTDLLDIQLSENHLLFKRLIANSEVGTSETRILGIPNEKIDMLLKKNILMAHANLTYTFHDRHVNRWFNERIEKAF